MLMITLTALLLTTCITSFKPAIRKSKCRWTDSRIANGPLVLSGEFPYQASLRIAGRLKEEIDEYDGDKDLEQRFGNEVAMESTHFCSGAIVGVVWVITAAHCITNEKGGSVIDASKIEVVVGTESSTEGTPYSVLQIIRHEKFVQQGLRHNIALLKLENGIKFSRTVYKVDIGENVVNVEECIFSGWSRTLANGISRYLAYLPLKTMTMSDCQVKLDKSNINEGHICTSPPFIKNICPTDDGGPLVADEKLIGVLSAKPQESVCDGDSPDVFVNVPFYYDWIRNTLREKGNWNKLNR